MANCLNNATTASGSGSFGDLRSRQRKEKRRWGKLGNKICIECNRPCSLKGCAQEHSSYCRGCFRLPTWEMVRPPPFRRRAWEELAEVQEQAKIEKAVAVVEKELAVVQELAALERQVVADFSALPPCKRQRPRLLPAGAFPLPPARRCYAPPPAVPEYPLRSTFPVVELCRFTRP